MNLNLLGLWLTINLGICMFYSLIAGPMKLERLRALLLVATMGLFGGPLILLSLARPKK